MKLGLVTRSSIPRPTASPWTKVVLPAPRSPPSASTSPGRSIGLSAVARRRVSATERDSRSRTRWLWNGGPGCVTSEESFLLGLFGLLGRLGHRLGQDRGHETAVALGRRILRGGLATTVQHGCGMEGRDDRTAVDVEALAPDP